MRNGILLETLLENGDLKVEKTLCLVVSPVSFNWKLRVITLRFVSFTKLAITRNNEISYAPITRNLRVTEFRWQRLPVGLSQSTCLSVSLSLVICAPVSNGNRYITFNSYLLPEKSSDNF